MIKSSEQRATVPKPLICATGFERSKPETIANFPNPFHPLTVDQRIIDYPLVSIGRNEQYTVYSKNNRMYELSSTRNNGLTITLFVHRQRNDFATMIFHKILEFLLLS